MATILQKMNSKSFEQGNEKYISSSLSPPPKLLPQRPTALYRAKITSEGQAHDLFALHSLRVPSPGPCEGKSMTMIKDDPFSPDEDPDQLQSTRSMEYLALGPIDRLKSASLEWTSTNGSVTPRLSHYNTHPPLDFKSLKQKLEQLTGSPDDAANRKPFPVVERRKGTISGVPILTSPLTERSSPDPLNGHRSIVDEGTESSRKSPLPFELHRCRSTGNLDKMEYYQPTSDFIRDQSKTEAVPWKDVVGKMVDKDDRLQKMLKRHRQELEDLKKKHELQWVELQQRLLQSGGAEMLSLENSQLHSLPSFQAVSTNTSTSQTVTKPLNRSISIGPTILVNDNETASGSGTDSTFEVTDKQPVYFTEVVKNVKEGDLHDAECGGVGVGSVGNQAPLNDGNLALDVQGQVEVGNSLFGIPYSTSSQIQAQQQQQLKPNFGLSSLLDQYQNGLAGLRWQLALSPFYQQLPIQRMTAASQMLPMYLGCCPASLRHPHLQYDYNQHQFNQFQSHLPLYQSQPMMQGNQWMTTRYPGDNPIESFAPSTSFNPNLYKYLLLQQLPLNKHTPCQEIPNSFPEKLVNNPSRQQQPFLSNAELMALIAGEMTKNNQLAALQSAVNMTSMLPSYHTISHTPCPSVDLEYLHCLRNSLHTAPVELPCGFDGIRPCFFPLINSSSNPFHTWS